MTCGFAILVRQACPTVPVARYCAAGRLCTFAIGSTFDVCDDVPHVEVESGVRVCACGDRLRQKGYCTIGINQDKSLYDKFITPVCYNTGSKVRCVLACIQL